MSASPRALSLALLIVAACGPDLVPLGADANFVWWSDFEAAEFSDWTGLPDGNGYTQASGSGQLREARAPLPIRSGARAMHAALGPHQAQFAHALVTRGSLPVEAWYTAWFFFPRQPEAKPFLTILKLSKRLATGKDQGVVGVVATQPDGTAAPYVVYLDSAKSLNPSPAVGLPIGRWFAVEAFVRLATDDTGSFAVYLDGQLIGEARGLVIAADDSVEWTLGPITVDTPGLDLFIDDASITRRRLGPRFQPFER